MEMGCVSFCALVKEKKGVRLRIRINFSNGSCSRLKPFNGQKGH